MKHKTFLSVFFLLSLAAGSASAKNPQDDVRVVCATQPLSTSYVLTDRADGGQVLDVVHHEGAIFMPIHEGLITTYDLKLLAGKAELFSRIGDRFSVVFSRGECSLKAGEWSCIRKGETALGGLSVRDLAFFLKKRKVETTLIAYESYRASLSFRIGGEGHTLPMEYAAGSCDLKR